MKKALALVTIVLGISGCSMLLNEPPVSSFRWSISYDVSPLTVSFDASSSYDADGYIRHYRWSFGDGSTAEGRRVSHTYSSYDTYHVQLYVEDNNGGEDTYWATVGVDFSSVGGFPFRPTSGGFWAFVLYSQQHWTYEHDAPGETCQVPAVSYIRMRGDCDDFATMVAYYTQEYFGFDSEIYVLDVLAGGVDHGVAAVIASQEIVDWYYAPCLLSSRLYVQRYFYPYSIYLPIDMDRCVGYGVDDVIILSTHEWYDLVGRPLSASCQRAASEICPFSNTAVHIPPEQ